MVMNRHELLAQFSTEYCCKNDASLTLVGDVSGLAHLFGYTAEEIFSTYQNSLSAMVAVDAHHNGHNALIKGESIECVLPVRHKNGSIVWVLNKAILQEADDGSTYLYGLLVEITRLKQDYDREKKATHALEEEAKKDSLTHIYNAYTTRKRAEAYLRETADINATLLIIDLDDFKQINDKFGHLFGDAVLVQTAKIIKKLFRSEDIVGRIGGEEFMVLMKETADLHIIHDRCNKLNAALQTMFGDEMPVCTPSCSIGVALLPKHANSYFDLFCCADRALYCAKAKGKRQYSLYDNTLCNIAERDYSLRYANYDVSTLRGYIDSDKVPLFSDDL